MSKQPFQITAQKQGATAQIRIIGEIGWDVNSEQFRTQIDDLVKQGATDAHLYINSPGGSCFDAAEIVNILSVFKGNVTGEGGALVASAGTYIAAHCKTFVMPENGQFMVHKPSGLAYGNAGAIAAYLKALQNIETDYYNTYKGLVKDITVFDAKWSAGDYWLTAQEAKAQGFITSVKPKVKIDRETAAMIKACGSPIETEINNPLKKDKEMDLKTTALMLGLPETATEEQVKAKLQANQKAAADLEAYQATQAQKEKTEREAKITAALNKAVADKRIKADAMGTWRTILENDPENGFKALEDITPIEKPTTSTGNGKTTHQGKTFEQLQADDPEALAELEQTDPEAFAELFADWKKRNKIQ